MHYDFRMTKAAAQHSKEADGSTSFIVKVHDHEAIGAAVLKLEALGIDVERVMKRTDVLGGRGPGRLLPQIAALPDVKHVRTELGFQLPPMHEGIPQ